jgi:hypothetical protein
MQEVRNRLFNGTWAFDFPRLDSVLLESLRGSGSDASAKHYRTIAEQSQNAVMSVVVMTVLSTTA